MAGRAQAALSWLSEAVRAGSGYPKTPKPHAGGIQTGRVGLCSIVGELGDLVFCLQETEPPFLLQP